MSALLSIENLATGYGPSQVLFGVDLELRVGEVATLLGRNGMGKSTTLKAIFAQLPAWQGEIRFLGERIDGRPTERIAQMGLAIVPEGRQIFPNLSVRENLVAFRDRRNGSASPGHWKGDTRCFRAWPSVPATWATSSRAASSRCSPSDGHS